jgi:hypothetical protein
MTSDAARTALRLSLAVERRLPNASETTVESVASRQSDEELLALCQSDDDHALAALFNRYGRLVLTIGFRTLKDYAEAEDLVQDVFLHIHERSRTTIQQRVRAVRGSYTLRIAWRSTGGGTWRGVASTVVQIFPHVRIL